MVVTFPEIRVGPPVRHQALSVFPLFTDPYGPVEYLLSDEALADGSVTVTEVSEAGSVPDLLVENKGERRVLFLEGEELVGAKQNRILNTSVLVAARSKAKIPVSCVEQGRWRYRSRGFGSGGRHSPSKLRYALKGSVARALKTEGAHRSDQAGIWEEVARQQCALGAFSASMAMSDTFQAHEQHMADFREKLKYVEGAAGVAVAIHERVVALDLFDKPSTCRKVWDRLLSGFVLDALEAEETPRQAEVADVDRLLQGFGRASWQQAEAVGEGAEHRTEFGQAAHASVLSLDGSLVHGSVVAAG
jgi:hypothetical protein